MSRLLLLGVGGVSAVPFPDTYITVGNGGDQEIDAAPTGLTYTFSNLTIGTADTRRQVVLIMTTNGGTNTDHTALTANAGAITFVKVVQNATGANANKLSLWIANVPTGTTLTAPTLTVSAASARGTLHGFMHGRGNTATDTLGVNGTTDVPPTGTIDHTANGLIIAGACTFGTTTGTTWTGVTEDFDYDAPTSQWRVTGGRHSGASGETGRTITATFDSGTSNNPRLVAAAYGAQV